MLFKVLLIFFVLYMLGVVVLIGYYLPVLLETYYSNKTPLQNFSGMVVYLALTGILFRFFIQPLSSVDAQKYLLLPVPAKSLITYIVIKPFLNPLNYVVLLLIIPFILSLSSTQESSTLWGLVLLFVIISMGNIQLAALFKRISAVSFRYFLLFLLFLFIVVVLDLTGLFPVRALSESSVLYLLKYPLANLILAACVMIITWLHMRYLSIHIYEDNYQKEKVRMWKDYPFFLRFGKVGELVRLELKLFIRHKRSRNILYTSLFLFFSGFLFFSPIQPLFQQYIGAVILTGMMILNYGTWVFSWNSSHFDMLMTKNISIQQYITANYLLLLLQGVFSFVCTLPYILIYDGLLLVLLSAFIYNVGLVIPFLLLIATKNTKRVELSTGSAMSFQGISWKNFLILFPVLLLPLIVVVMATILSYTNQMFFILGVLGILGLIFTRMFLKLAESLFIKRKYTMIEGFQESE